MHALSITYVFNSNDDRRLLFGDVEYPPKMDDEATYVMYPEDASFEDIIKAVPVFRDAEPGSDESISGSIEELLDKYGLDIEAVEEEVGQDLDSDGCDPSDPDHLTHEEELYHSDPSEAVYTESRQYYTDPSAAFPRGLWG